jgi:hypothetical protein
MADPSIKAKQTGTWRRWLQAVYGWWRVLSLLGKTSVVMAALTVVWLLAISPWQDGGYSPRRQATAILVLMSVALFYTLILFPDFVSTYRDDIAFCVGFAAALLTIGSKASREFYVVVAQVLPLLFVALAFEGRAFRVSKDMDIRARHFTALPAYGLLIGEAESLRGIIVEDQTTVSLQLVVGSLTVGGVALVLHAIVGRPDK